MFLIILPCFTKPVRVTGQILRSSTKLFYKRGHFGTLLRALSKKEKSIERRTDGATCRKPSRESLLGQNQTVLFIKCDFF